MRIDAHQHFWQLSRGDYGWLTPELDVIYRDFLPSDLASYLQKANIDKTVLVQAAPTLEETRFLLELAHEYDFIAAVVGWVDMATPDAAEIIAELAQNPYLKSIRPMIQDIDDPQWILKDRLTPGVESLLEHKLCFDALVLPQHLSPLKEFIERHPTLPVVIDHGAKPEIHKGEITQWARDIDALAQHPQVFCKLSGLLTEAGENASAEQLAPYMQQLLKSFGAERLLWGSDWPVLNLASDYIAWIDMVENFIAPLSEQQQRQIMGENAAQFYQLQDD